MQKKIIALAVAAVASGAAFAQTNVTISGNLNYQFENISGSTPTMAGNVANFVPQASREGRSRLNEFSSELAFKATEDLGNGLKAGVVIASGLQPTDSGNGAGNNSNIGGPGSGIGGGSNSRGGLGGRDSFVFLGGKFGELRAGRLSVHYNSHNKLDDFGNGAGIATNSWGILNNNGGVGYGTGGTARVGNTLQYITPTFSGFNANFVYSRPNASNRGNAAASVTSGLSIDGVIVQGASVVRKESAWNVGANFDNGPLSAFLSYNAVNDASAAAVAAQNTANNAITLATIGGNTAGTNVTRENRGFRMGAGYSFANGLKISFIYDNTKTLYRDDTGNAATADDDLTIKRTAWSIPVKWTFGPHTVGATYAKANNIQTGGTVSTALAANLDTNGTGARYWMAGYQYAFSKRTNVGVTFARIDNDQRAGYDFFSNGAMGMHVTGATSALSSANNTRGSDPTSVAIGLKHSF